jgi:C_GCAxxG_C_C family probable redox protein
MNEIEISEKAVNNFVNDSYNCAEAIMAAVSESKGIGKNTFTSFATGFGGGIGSKGHICGALTGGLMALGWIAKDKGLQKPVIREMSGKLYDGFEAGFGSTLCSVLTSLPAKAQRMITI